MAAYYKVEVSLNTNAVEVGIPSPQTVNVVLPNVGPAGPAGPAGTGLETLQVQGDLLYQGASTGERLPIGTTGQVLKVSSGGLPAWAAESGAVTSVNGITGAVALLRNNIGATRVFEEINGTSQNPTQINVASLYNSTTQSLNVAVMLTSLDPNSHGSVFLPLLDSQSVGRVSVRLSVRQGADPSFVRVQTTDGVNAVNVFPPSSFSVYDEISNDQDYVFVWIGDRWDLDILATESSTTAHDLRKPNHGGLLAAWSGGKPATPTSTGIPGQMQWGYDDGAERLYICVANNTWRRVPISTWS